MLIANTLKCHLGLNEGEILKLFLDDMRDISSSGFSIQNFVYEALQKGRFPGDWYSIGLVSQIIETLNMKYHPVDNFQMI